MAKTSSEQNQDICQSIEHGLAYLSKSQLPSGEFKAYWSNHPTMADEGTLDSVPIFSSFIAYSLSFSQDPLAKHMTTQAAKYLSTEMLKYDVWKYWTAQNPYYSHLPPDVDDTACASIVLRQNGGAALDNVKLILANRDRQGRLYTWLIPRLPAPFCMRFWLVVLRLNPIKTRIYFRTFDAVEPDDVDGVINANVLAYVGTIPGTEGIVKYLLDIAEQGLEADCDKWYRNPLIFYYSLSRCYAMGMNIFERVKDSLTYRITALANPDGSIGDTDLDLALAICSLLNFGHRSSLLDNAVAALIKKQGASGNWQRSAFYYAGPQHAGPVSYHGWGSEELTTGFCLEALIRYNNRSLALTREENSSGSESIATVRPKTISRIWHLVRAQQWWNYKLPLVVLPSLAIACSANLSARQVIPSLILLIGAGTIAGIFASVLNDFADLDQDRLSGKLTVLMSLSKAKSIGLLIASIASFVLAAFVLSPYRLACLCFLLVALVHAAYDLKPLRLKERGIAGVICIALGEHLLPTFFAIFLLLESTKLQISPIPWLLGFGITSFCFGLRGIIWHQLCDVNNDNKAGCKTLATGIEARHLITTARWFILPIELIGILIVLLVSKSLLAAIFLLPYFLIDFLRMKYLQSKLIVAEPVPDGRFILFDYYRIFCPLAFIFTLCARDSEYYWILSAFVILFGAPMLTLIIDSFNLSRRRESVHVSKVRQNSSA